MKFHRKVMHLAFIPALCLVNAVFLNALSANDSYQGLPPPGKVYDEFRTKNSQVEQDSKHYMTNNGVTNVTTASGDKALAAQRKPRILRVGPNEEFALPSNAAATAIDGDTIEIDGAGKYIGDEVIWKQNNLHIKGVNGRPIISAKNNISNGKALWVIQGNNTTVENIEFTGAKVSDHNGAGIRHEGVNLTIRYCYFHHNENGILTGKMENNDVLIEYTEFAHNGAGDGKTHNIYIGMINSFTLQYSNSHHAYIGHNVKSRARENRILFNRIADENDGKASYQLDFPNGGETYLVGNVIQQGENAENWAIIAFGLEGVKYEKNNLFLVNNTIVNDRSSGQYINNKSEVNLVLINNIFAGKGKTPEYNLLDVFNLIKENPKFISRKDFDYRLAKDSEAIDKGAELKEFEGKKVTVEYEYLHNSRARPRKKYGPIDLGAFEYLP